MTNPISLETPNPMGLVRGATSIARELERAITSSTYTHGQQLPTERQLAQTFDASRTTVRKALAMLENQKLVQRRAGSGTYVSFQAGASQHDIAEKTSPLELIEVRAAIEPQMARLAVLHASAVDLDRLQNLVNELLSAEQASDAELYAAVDEQFHLAIAAATSNPLLVWLYEQINVIRTHALVGRDAQQNRHARKYADLQQTASGRGTRHPKPRCGCGGGDHGPAYGEGAQ